MRNFGGAGMKKFFVMVLCGIGLGFFCFEASAFANYPGSSPPGYPLGSSAGAVGNQDFGAQVTQNTQKALQIFSGVNTAAFLKTDDSDFVGFGGGSSEENKLLVDVSPQDLSEKQSDLDAQIEGDWNE
jgi:hypothetical protein